MRNGGRRLTEEVGSEEAERAQVRVSILARALGVGRGVQATFDILLFVDLWVVFELAK